MIGVVKNAWDKRPRSRSLVIAVLIAAAIAAAAAVGIVVWLQWEWLRASEPNTWLPSSWEWLGSSNDSKAYNGDILRNVGFIVAGVVALIFALWRARVAGRQANAAQAQVATAQQSLLNERYQRGAEMLGSPVLSVRLGGIFALQRLAEEHPEQYHIQVMRLFCAFVRNPPAEGGELNNNRELRPDVQAVITAIGKRSVAGQRLEAEADCKLDLRGARLDYGDMENLNFASVDLLEAHLRRAGLEGANLSDAILAYADLSGATLWRANFSGAYLAEAHVSAALLGDASVPENLDAAIHPGEYVRISQRQLDQAVALLEYPPNIHDGATDPYTGKPLEWRGGIVIPQS